jgi:hypothetical protein
MPVWQIVTRGTLFDIENLVRIAILWLLEWSDTTPDWGAIEARLDRTKWESAGDGPPPGPAPPR